MIYKWIIGLMGAGSLGRLILYLIKRQDEYKEQTKNIICIIVERLCDLEIVVQNLIVSNIEELEQFIKFSEDKQYKIKTIISQYKKHIASQRQLLKIMRECKENNERQCQVCKSLSNLLKDNYSNIPDSVSMMERQEQSLNNLNLAYINTVKETIKPYKNFIKLSSEASKIHNKRLSKQILVAIQSIDLLLIKIILYDEKKSEQLKIESLLIELLGFIGKIKYELSTINE